MRIDVNSITRKLEVDNRIPLHHYYRIADNLLRQANVYREERNVVDLYIILLRFSSLVSETIPPHRDYPAMHPKEKTRYKKKMLNVLDELEALRPEFKQLVEEFNKGYDGPQLFELDRQERTGYTSERASMNRPSIVGGSFSGIDKRSAGVRSSSPWRYRNDHSQILSPNPVQLGKQFQKT